MKKLLNGLVILINKNVTNQKLKKLKASFHDVQVLCVLSVMWIDLFRLYVLFSQ